VGIEAFDRVHLDGTGIDRITEAEVVAIVRDALMRGRGGRIVTPNIDILRRAQREPEARRFLEDADLVVADGMPLIWASKLGGAPLPERVAGSSLIWSLSGGLGRDRRSIYVIGGEPAREGASDGATRAADRLAAACPGLRVAGALCPPYGF
jgi:N-acetylglucosaminyldiphosphoundecaprenol N-acetyl-beta-D-mannosaminyltransferase